MVRWLILVLGGTLSLAPFGLAQGFHPTDTELLAAAELGYRHKQPLSGSTIFYRRMGLCAREIADVALFSPLLEAYLDGHNAWKAFEGVSPVEVLRQRNGTVRFIVVYGSSSRSDEAHVALRQADRIFRPLKEKLSPCGGRPLTTCRTSPIWACATEATFAIDKEDSVTSREPAELLVRRTVPAEQSVRIEWQAWSAKPDSDLR